ncbi:MAG TPA: hypothetical protein VMJ31_01045 [Methylocystis sp.]|nr:hypothetical protein [Methylocystis sp.]
MALLVSLPPSFPNPTAPEPCERAFLALESGVRPSLSQRSSLTQLMDDDVALSLRKPGADILGNL